MIRFSVLALAVLLILGAAIYAVATRPDVPTTTRRRASRSKTIAIRSDPAWAPTGGCANKRGDVTFAEFAGELSSSRPLFGGRHQAWQMEPAYLEITAGTKIKITNTGVMRSQSFTEVAAYGGGKIRTRR